MTTLNIGDKAPVFNLPATGGQTIGNNDLLGAPYVLYFYPKDDTPGCTAEACDFNNNLKMLENLKIKVFGVSKDNMAAHEKFKAKYKLQFDLLSDSDGALCNACGVWVEKSMYGKKYMGIARTTLLIDKTGIITKIWANVKVPDHVNDVLTAAKALD